MVEASYPTLALRNRYSKPDSSESCPLSEIYCHLRWYDRFPSLSVDPRKGVDAGLESSLSKPVSSVNQEMVTGLASPGGFSKTLC